ncbi:MAG TPA: hypothetical protein VF121_08880 [Thermoanaerobaculia bacterium]|nr:hypothetical protein [Thermoanaerobaculia bacterium]
MVPRSIRRPLVLFLLPWLLALLDGLVAFRGGGRATPHVASSSLGKPAPASGCTLDPWGGCH